MDRWACVDVKVLPLQLLLRREPEWRSLPVVVVNEDRPQGTVLFTNTRARELGALTGQSYAVALSLVRGLRAGAVSNADIVQAQNEIKSVLWRFSPRVEESGEQGVFWLDASGFGSLYPRLSRWTKGVENGLAKLALEASVVVGFSRFGSYAVARVTQGQRVFDDVRAEREALEKVKLARLDIEPEFRDVLDKLGVYTVAQLVQLPAAGLLSRFGKTAYRLHELATGDLLTPMRPSPWIEALLAKLHLDDAESDATRLLFLVKRLLDSLVPKLVLRGEAIASLSLTCALDRSLGVIGPEEIRPAVPTLDVVLLLDLVRLRLETLSLAAGVITIELEAEGVAATPEQLRVFVDVARRDLAAGGRALARLRAELGEDAVVRAELRPAHLPEAAVDWQPVIEVKAPKLVVQAANVVRFSPTHSASSAAVSLARRPLIRRMYMKQTTLHAPPRIPRNDGWLIRDGQSGPVTHRAGPFLISGGWWVREVEREYHYVLTQRGDLLWMFYDRKRCCFRLHGEVQ